MSTKSSIKWREQSGSTPGFHLYDDVLDYQDDAPVYLRLDGVHAEMQTQAGGATVTVILPREMARELGLLPAMPPNA